MALSPSASYKSHYQNFTPPFEIPKSWRWVRLEEIAYFGGGKTPSTDVRSYWENGTNLWVTSKDMKSSHIKDSKIKITDCALSQMTLYAKGTLLLVTRSGILRHSLPIAILDYPATVNQDIKTISCFSSNLNKFVLWAIKAQEELILKDFHKDGTTVDSIDFDKFKSLSLPIPPKEEQKRIISQIELLFGYTSQIDDSRDHITKLVSATKSKILDLAMQGKLVPQDSTDEPAADMLRRINPKARIITDNPHYPQLPDNWVLTKLGDVVKVINGKSQKEVENPSGAYPIYGSGGVIGKADAYSCLSGSTIIGRKGTINNPQFIETNFWNVDTAFGMKPYEAVNDLYFYYFCKSFDFTSLDKSSTLPSLTKTAIEGILMPTPPLGEQRRIILKIKEYDELFRNIFTQIGQK